MAKHADLTTRETLVAQAKAGNEGRENQERARLLSDAFKDRPAVCCGVCPPILGGGYDCTCQGNPRCPGPRPDTSLTGEEQR